MAYFVYIIQSDLDQSYYKGFTEDPMIRVQRHNAGESVYTRTKIPWKLVFVEELPSKREALIREKVLKKYSHQQIEMLIASPRNIVTKFI